MIVNFEKVSMTGFKAGGCQACGKRAARHKEFFQTINPFNKNTDGQVKDRSEINKELSEDIYEWSLQPVYHAKCEKQS